MKQNLLPHMSGIIEKKLSRVTNFKRNSSKIAYIYKCKMVEVELLVRHNKHTTIIIINTQDCQVKHSFSINE